MRKHGRKKMCYTLASSNALNGNNRFELILGANMAGRMPVSQRAIVYFASKPYGELPWESRNGLRQPLETDSNVRLWPKAALGII